MGTGESRGPGLSSSGTLRLKLGSPLIHRFHVGQLRALGAALVLGCGLLPACTLITDVNREDIPTETPVFPEVDAGSDASAPNPDPVVPVDAGAADAGETLSDAGADAGDNDAGDDDGIIDAGGDAG
jgi:hypothetical protein